MTRREWLWLAVVVLFATLNALGAWYAVVRGEMMHCLIHVVLLVAMAPVTWWIVTRREASY